jgi:anti-sigma-K factor RskA
MPAPPVDEHTEEFEQLAGLSALHVLEGDELARFERHAAQCERCRLMVRLDREALARLSLAAPEMEPSPDFKARLMRRAAEELTASAQRREPPAVSEAPTPPAEPLPLRPRPADVIPFWRRANWVSALAAVLVVGIVSFSAFTYLNQPIEVVQLQGSTPGSATVIVRRGGAAELELRGLPEPGQGFVYEAWIIPPGQQPVAAGVAARGEAKLSLEGDPRGATVAITREPGRVSAPTSPPLLVGEVRL